MPYRKPYRRRRRPLRRRRYRKKRTLVPRNLRNTGFLSTKQKTESYVIVPSGTLTGGGHGVGFSFALADLPQATTFQKLFDQYRITGVASKMLPMTSFNTGGTNPSIRLLHYTDLDDANAPSLYSDVIQRSNLKDKMLVAGSARSVNSFIRPRWLNATYATSIVPGTGTGYSLGKRSTWIDTVDDTVPHFGYKYFFNTTNNATPGGLAVPVNVLFTLTYYLQFKGLK
jgi:hypothetical protein